MKLSLTASGLLDPRRLDSWVPEITRVSQRIGTVIPGATPSLDSSGPDTAIPTS